MDDNIAEVGAYILSKTALIADRLDLVLAGRLDTHSRLDENVFSPRAALVFELSEGHHVRATYNRAFSTPTTLNHFLDISGGPAGDLGRSDIASKPKETNGDSCSRMPMAVSRE